MILPSAASVRLFAAHSIKVLEIALCWLCVRERTRGGPLAGAWGGLDTRECHVEKEKIRLLQFFVCRDFTASHQDAYLGQGVFGNLYTPSFPYRFEKLYAVTCWRKDERFHKEVIEYETDYGTKTRSPHMDIEPITDSVLFRWHKHRFPSSFVIEKPTHLTIRVILDWEVLWETYILIEGRP